MRTARAAGNSFIVNKIVSEVYAWSFTWLVGFSGKQQRRISVFLLLYSSFIAAQISLFLALFIWIGKIMVSRTNNKAVFFTNMFIRLFGLGRSVTVLSVRKHSRKPPKLNYLEFFPSSYGLKSRQQITLICWKIPEILAKLSCSPILSLKHDSAGKSFKF